MNETPSLIFSLGVKDKDPLIAEFGFQINNNYYKKKKKLSFI